MTHTTPAITRAAERVEKHWRLWTGRPLWPSRAERIARDMLDVALPVEEAQQVLGAHQVSFAAVMGGSTAYATCTCPEWAGTHDRADGESLEAASAALIEQHTRHQAEALRAAILGGAV